MTLTVRTTGLEDYLEGGKGKIKLLLGGPPGAGKTRFASFAPKPIYADCEDGLMSVADRRVPYASIKSVEDMNALLDLLDAECKKPEASRRFGTVVIDTLDAYQRLVTTSYLRKMRKDAMSGWEDWGYLDSKMTSLLARLFLLPMNVIALMHVKDMKINEMDQTIPKLKGDMRDQIAADFDFVGLIEPVFGPAPSDKGGVERKLLRSIKWEPTPMAPWLKCRGGALTETPVVFKTEDWTVIHDGIAAQLAGLQAAEMVQQIETEAVEPVPVSTGGPVQGRGATSVAKSATAPAPAPAPSVAPRPTTVSPPPAKPAPVIPATEGAQPANPPTMDQAVETVKEVLGGTVVAEDPPAPVVDQVDQVADPVVETPVAEAPSAAQEAAVPQASEPTITPSLDLPSDGTVTVACGQPRFSGGVAKNPGAGCGKPLTITLADGKITAADGDEDPSLIEIAGLRERAFLHNACYGRARNAK